MLLLWAVAEDNEACILEEGLKNDCSKNTYPFIWWRKRPEFPISCKRHGTFHHRRLKVITKPNVNFSEDDLKRTFVGLADAPTTGSLTVPT